jgi:DNA-binding CsgD family transcriptional regulator
MIELFKSNWPRVNDFLLSINSGNLDELFTKILEEIPGLIPFGSPGCLIDVNNNLRPRITKAIQMGGKWNDYFNDYYYKIATPPAYKENIYSASNVDLEKNNRDEYVNDFLIPQYIKYSAGLTIFNYKNEPEYTFIFNRMKSEPMYSEEELTMLNVIQLHIGNYYKLLYQIEKLLRLPIMPLELEKNTRLLSRRESEIISLLLNRLKPADIARELKISVLTIKKHIQNIYYKLHVTDRQQLLEKINSDISLKKKTFWDY